MYLDSNINFKDIEGVEIKFKDNRLSFETFVFSNDKSIGARNEIAIIGTYDQFKKLHSVLGEALTPKLPAPTADDESMDMISGLNEARNFPKDGAGFDVLVENIMGDGYLKKESNQ